MARRFLRITRALAKSHCIYLPSHLREGQTGTNAEAQTRAQYIVKTWSDFLLKWKRLGLHEEAFAPETPLGDWRIIVQEIYEIDLPI